MKSYILSFYILLGISVTSLASPQLLCKNIFSNFSIVSIDLAIEDLAKLRLNLELSKIQGSSSLALTALNHDYEVEAQKLISYLETNNIMTLNEFYKKLKPVIARLQNEELRTRKSNNKKKEDQIKVIKEALSPINLAHKIIFQKISPGKFKMGEIQIDTEITKPYELMSTLVTQAMWAKLKIAMGERDLEKINPSIFKTGADSITINIEGINVQIQPNHPVENISWNDVKEFVVGLQKLSNSNNPKTHILLQTLIPDHEQGDIYDFPTSAQWEFVMKNRGQANKTHFDREDTTELASYAWSFLNSNNQSHAVATLQPRMIEEKPFYDLEGNVWEWTKDATGINIKLLGGKDPLATSGPYRTLYGGSWNYGVQALGYKADSTAPDDKSSDTGFRLVRIKP